MAGTGEPAALVNLVIWTLRIVLPIILFVLYYRVSLSPATLFARHKRTRDVMLQYRSCDEGGKRPEALSNLTTIGQDEAPELFVKKHRVGRAGKGSVDKGAGKGQAAPAGSPTVPDALQAEKLGKSVPVEKRGTDKYNLGPDGMLHLESLLNYMAFNRKSHRIFHPTEVPPPPSAPPPPDSKAPMSNEFSAKANLDAQMVLHGAINFTKYDIVGDVYESLQAAKVPLAEKTFSLMVDGCVRAKDLPKASEYLMKMEQQGFTPNSTLLDSVMDLYAVHKMELELKDKLAPELEQAKIAGLAADAPEFLPEFIPSGAMPAAGESSTDYAAAGEPQAWDQSWGEQSYPEWSPGQDYYPKSYSGGDWSTKEWKGGDFKPSSQGKGESPGWYENKNWNGKGGNWSQGWNGKSNGYKGGKDKGKGKGKDKGAGKGKGKDGKNKDTKDKKDAPKDKDAKKSGGKAGGKVWREKKPDDTDGAKGGDADKKDA